MHPQLKRWPPLAISTGDPGGVGPEVALRAVASAALDDRVVVFGDARALGAAAAACGVDLDRLRVLRPDAELELPLGGVGLVDVGVSWDAAATQHAATAAGGAAQLAALDAAAAAARAGRVRALVTAPMSKAAVQLAGQAFTGHTEHLARGAGLADDAVTMMFLGPRLRVALATTHVAVADLPREVTRARVERAIEHLAQALLRLGETQRKTQTRALRIAVTGLNPHAGEGGLFGHEEERAIAPAVAAVRARAPFAAGRVQLEGPLGAETALRLAAADQVDGVVAMTHDQATIASKLLDWTQAVNVTWGLPFVRTSVDHGVAYDAAQAGTADPAGMISALSMAQRLSPSAGERRDAPTDGARASGR